MKDANDQYYTTFSAPPARVSQHHGPQVLVAASALQGL
jgi:hypothetical protein